jgi:hypothetical protein
MRFRYLKDPLFLACVLVYFANRWILKPYCPNEFCRCYLNDFICLPFWIPIMLFIMRKLGLRRDDAPPKSWEWLVPLLIWSWVFEVYLPSVPYFSRLATADYLDILAYTSGACVAAITWKRTYKTRGTASYARVLSPG